MASRRVLAGPSEALRVGGGDDIGRDEVEIAVRRDRARRDVDAQVLPRVADHAQTIGDRVEVDAEVRAIQCRERIGRVGRVGSQHRNVRGRTGRDIDRVEPRSAAHCVEQVVGGAEVDTEERLAGLQAGDCDGRRQLRWSVACEGGERHAVQHRVNNAVRPPAWPRTASPICRLCCRSAAVLPRCRRGRRRPW